MIEGHKKYNISSPDHNSDHLHRPKLRKAQLEVLKDLVNFGTSFISDNPITMNQYTAYEKDQLETKSLRKYDLLNYILNLLENDNLEDFVKSLWSTDIEGLDSRSNQLLHIIQYILTTFHLIFRNISILTQNHERTPFIENIVPSLLSLTKVTGLIEFK